MGVDKVRKKAKRAALNVANRTLFIRDNLDVLSGLNSESVDLIYLDPPFNSNRHYAAPIGSKAAGASFKDAWTLDDIDLAWAGQIAESYPAVNFVIRTAGAVGGKGNQSYLTFMARRLLEMHRVLKPTGSIYLHCDPTMSHSLKLLMDAVFGRKNFRNEIVWCYSGGGVSKRDFPRKHDVILRYAGRGKWRYRPEYKPYKENTRQVGKHSTYSGGHRINLKRGTPVTDWWPDIKTATGWSPERTGYPTQKPVALLARVIHASSNAGDVVLDPFCGCATALVAAEILERQWIGADISPLAKNLVKTRLQDAQDMLTTKGAWKDVSVSTNAPVRTDGGDLSVKPKEYSHELYGMQDGKCAGCRHWFPFRNMTVDHIQPREKGGGDIKPNLQLLCAACNSVKGGRPMEYLRAHLKKTGII